MKQMILPYPQKIACGEGFFDLRNSSVSVAGNIDYRVVKAAVKVRNEIAAVTGNACDFSAGAGRVTVKEQVGLPKEGYILAVTPEGICIAGGDAAGCFYGLQTLRQLIGQYGQQIPCMEIEDYPDMKHRGFYHDATRGRVPTVDGVKKIIDTLAYYKINSLQLYVEHTFDFKEFRGEGRTTEDYLTAEEILELDAYCYDHFIDFIPSLSTFGHLYELLTRKRYQHLCELENYEDEHHFWYERMRHHTIDVSNPESKEMIYSLIDQYLPLFRSEYFNICCDETFDLCKGRNKGKNVAEAYTGFVKLICEHVTQLGKKVMMWGDIALEHPESIGMLPEGVIVLNWNYAADPSEEKVATIAKNGVPQIICPGTTSWSRIVEQVSISRPNIYYQAQYAYKYGAEGLLNTNWGDFGHPASFQCALYSTVMGAGICWNRNTQFDETFELTASKLLWDAEINVVKLLEQLGDTQKVAAWYNLFMWEESRDVASFTVSTQDAQAAAALCEEIYQQFEKLPVTQEREHLLVAAEGLGVLNRAVTMILQNVPFGTWAEEADRWLTRYEKLWLSECKRSELYEIRKFVMNIPNPA